MNDTPIDTLAEHAERAATGWAALTPLARATAIVAASDALESARDELIDIAREETGLTEARLSGELTRTIVQLRLFAQTARDGSYLDVRIDELDPSFALGQRPDLRRYLVPLGPVLNFAASNFPFAFSVAGGDTAAALAAGCSVIVKAHSGHPRLSVRTAEVVAGALEAAGAPPFTLQLVTGQQNGLDLLRDPRIQAASFTGSTSVGRILADIAAARPAPIPFFGELGSLNPVFITAAAVQERGESIAQGLMTSVSGSAGQLCTKPGFVFLPEQHGLDQTLRDAARPVAEHRLLTPSIAGAFSENTQRILDTPGVEVVVAGSLRTDGDYGWATPTVVKTSTQNLQEHADLLVHEVFGPFVILVEYPADSSLRDIAAAVFQGNLTATVHAAQSDHADIGELVQWMSSRAGRVLFGGWPTGVSVTPAQQHGGPWPATTNDSSTSVGTAAIGRFLRPVAYQDFPQALLPEPLRDDNPWGIPQHRSVAGESQSWGALG